MILNKDHHGADQVEDGPYEGSEEINPDDELSLFIHITHVEDNEDNSKDHLNGWQRNVSRLRISEADQYHHAKNDLDDE